MEEGTSFIAVPIKLSTFKPSTFLRFFGKFSTFEHPKRSRHSSNFKLQMELGRHTRFFQSLTLKEIRPIKHSIDEGNYFIVVPFKLSTFRLLAFPKSFGKLSNFEHPERSSSISNFKLQMVLGRRSRFLQAFRVNEVRPTKRSTDEGSSLIAVQFRERCCKYFMFPTNFGIFFYI